MTSAVKTESPQTPNKPRRVRDRRNRPIQHAIEYALFRAAFAAVAVLPHRVISAICAELAAFYGFVNQVFRMQHHTSGLVNLEIAFPRLTLAERKRIFRNMWRMWGRYLADTIYLTRMTRVELRDLIDLDTVENYVKINENAKQRGVLILTGHFGSFELLHSAMAATGTPVCLVQRAMNNPKFEVFLRDLRQTFGTKTLIRGNAAREVFRELRLGSVVAIPFDQGARWDSRVFAPFFGVDASTNTGLARLALRSGAAVHPVFLVRIGTSLRHRAVLGPELDIVNTGDMEKDVAENTRRFNLVFEAMVREHPDHWIWMYRRWRQQPDGRSSPYVKGAPPLDTYRQGAATSALAKS